ncbi:MAG: DUF3006 family protein [Clostridia bacterium]|nr:DUF3006 family protein [Clostridia bacterium]
MKFPIDRIEFDKIILELPDCTTTEIDLALAPSAKEGDVLEIKVEQSDKQEASSLLSDLFN